MQIFLLYIKIKIRKYPCKGKYLLNKKTKLDFLPFRRFFYQSWIQDHYGEFSLKVEKLKIPFLDGLCQKMASYDNQKRVCKNWRLGIFRNPRWPPPLLKFFKNAYIFSVNWERFLVASF